MYCSKVQLHGLEEWCVGVVQLNQRTSLSRAVQAGSQAVRHSDNVNTETGVTRALYLFPDQVQSE